MSMRKTGWERGALDAIEARLGELEMRAKSLVSTLGAGNTGSVERANLVGILQQIGDLQGAASAAWEGMWGNADTTDVLLAGRRQASLEVLGTLTPLQRMAYDDVQSSNMLAEMAALQARGSGTAMVTALQAGLDDMALLPDGMDSLAYARQSVKLRNAIRDEFDQESLVEFDIPRARLEGALDRSRLLPFDPSNRFGLEMQLVAQDQRQVGRLESYLQQRRESGQLSEREEWDLTRQIERLKTEEARGIGTLQNGLDDQLPALSAGRPAAFGRFDSFELAAMRLWMRGSPRRAYGAINGAQQQMQDDFALSWEGGDLNSHGSAQHADMVGAGMGRLVDALNRLADAILQGGGRSGSPLHPGESANRAGGLLNANGLPPRPGGWN